MNRHEPSYPKVKQHDRFKHGQFDRHLHARLHCDCKDMAMVLLHVLFILHGDHLLLLYSKVFYVNHLQVKMGLSQVQCLI